TFEHVDRVDFVAFAPDGQTLAALGMDGTLKLWDVPTGEERSTFTGHKFDGSVAFSPDSRTLAAGSEDKALRLWDVSTAEKRLTLMSEGGGRLVVAFSP